jgi:hypothetical protein
VHETAAHKLAENFRGSSFLNCSGALWATKQMATVTDRRYNHFVNEHDEIPPKRNYKWPWFVAAAVVLGIILAVVWMGYAVHREKQERNFSAPIPAGAK